MFINRKQYFKLKKKKKNEIKNKFKRKYFSHFRQYVKAYKKRTVKKKKYIRLNNKKKNIMYRFYGLPLKQILFKRKIDKLKEMIERSRYEEKLREEKQK